MGIIFNNKLKNSYETLIFFTNFFFTTKCNEKRKFPAKQNKTWSHLNFALDSYVKIDQFRFNSSSFMHELNKILQEVSTFLIP